MSRTYFAAPALYSLALLMVSVSCSTPSPTTRSHSVTTSSVAGPMNRAASPGVAAAASPIEAQEYRELYTLYSKGAYEAALQKLQAFEKSYPQSAMTSQVENLHGLSYLLTKRPAQAVPHFQRALEENGANPSMSRYLMYNLADAQFEAGLLEEAQKTAMGLQPESMDRENRIKAHYLKARIDTKRGLPTESARECLAAGKLLLPTTSHETRTAVAALLDQNMKEIPDLAVLEELYRGYEESTLSDQVLFQLGSKEIAAGSREKGEAHLKILMSRYPESPYYSQASELTRGSQPPANSAPSSETLTPSHDSGPVDSKAVGVLLPMKGKFAKFGARSLQGIELAFHIFNTSEPDSKITLVIEDSGDEAESALRAFNKLVIQHHVVAVIGPLMSKGIDQITTRAQELGVPLLSLSRHNGVQADYIFQAGLTLNMQTREIARYAIEKLGIKRFAMVYPRDKVGEESMQRFWDAVEELGGKITGLESYNTGETDFRQPIDKLAGLFYTDARVRELEALARERQVNNIKKRTRKTEQYFGLKPVVDFEAVFIPEEPKVAGQILPTFAYRDVDHVKFLGTSAWNSPELGARAQTYAESAFFLDAFLPESDAPLSRKYVEKYKATYGQDPTAMDALAYDAARLLESILARNPGASRTEVRDQMKTVKNFPGVTGKITYRDGQLLRDLKILTTKAGKVIEAPTGD